MAQPGFKTLVDGTFQAKKDALEWPAGKGGMAIGEVADDRTGTTIQARICIERAISPDVAHKPRIGKSHH
jgi:hypothetical protein